MNNSGGEKVWGKISHVLQWNLNGDVVKKQQHIFTYLIQSAGNRRNSTKSHNEIEVFHDSNSLYLHTNGSSISRTDSVSITIPREKEQA